MQKARMVVHAGLFCGICRSETGLLAMDVIEDSGSLIKRDALEIFASKLAPTKSKCGLARQNNPSLSGNSYSAATFPDFPGLLNVGSFSRHSTR